MSAREWKPGDVALARINPKVDGRDVTGGWSPVIRDNVGGWASGVAAGREVSERDITDLRPLVVIDAEDREQVERLHSLYESLDKGVTADDMQAALREFASPTPPKPDEPMGLGAVVEDEAGEQWTRFSTEGIYPWMRNGGGNKNWSDITVVRVLSEGVRND